MAEAVAGDRVRDPVECTDRDSDLVVHMGKEMDMFQLERDFNVSAWAYGQPEEIDGVFFAWRFRRSPARHGGAQLYRVRWGYGLGRVWPSAVMTLNIYS
ncbi:hypothetical protein Syun_007209 [Stephania yunnanensis]|uniref:Uncharacterized protein n=1 Tax=Stephania yunnanensis TaxID=152371 RepID=A0AAP0PYG3_9MAGN